MNNSELIKIQIPFSHYQKSLSAIENDISFWYHFINHSITNLVEVKHTGNREVFSSIFNAYDIDMDSRTQFLMTFKKSTVIRISELQDSKRTFFSWVMNNAILNAYNALEILLIESIQIVFYSALTSPIKGRRHVERIHKEVENYLKNNNLPYESKNNRHLVDFLKNRNGEFNKFIDYNIRGYRTSTWGKFFELISVLRNIIAHHGMMVNLDVQNELKSLSKEIFIQHFDLTMVNNHLKLLQPKEDAWFVNFIGLINTFSLNTIKILFNQADLSFLDV